MIEYNQPVGNVRFVNSLKTFKNIVKEIIELVKKQRNIINFFIKNEGFNFCFVNFKNPESWIQNDLMLAKIKITGKEAYVIWINGMTSKINVSELNIVPLTAASISNNRRINPNPEEGSLESMANGESPNKDNSVGKIVNLWETPEFNFIVKSMELSNTNIIVLGNSGFSLIKNLPRETDKGSPVKKD